MRWSVAALLCVMACTGDPKPETDVVDTPDTEEDTEVEDSDPLVTTCTTVEFDDPIVGTYLQAPNWNQWVRAAQTSQVCEPEGTSCDDCWHGGEHRTTTVITGCTCDDVRVSDALGVLVWSCTEPGGGRLELNSSGFRAGKGLGDLIDATTLSWRENSLRVEVNGETVESPPAAWWTNPIAEATTTLDQPGTIYVANSDLASTITVAADGVGLLIAPDVVQTGTGTESVVVADGVDRVWIEGDIDATGRRSGVDLTDGALAVVHRADVTGGTSAGIQLSGVISSRVAAIASEGSQYHGVSVSEGSDGTCVRGGAVTSAGGAGVAVSNSNDVRVALMSITGSGEMGLSITGGERVRARAISVVDSALSGVLVDGTYALELSNLRVGNSQDNGVLLQDQTRSPVINDAVVVGSGDSGIEVFCDNAVLTQVTSVGNGDNGIHMRGGNGIVSGALTMSNGGRGLYLDGGGSTVINIATTHNAIAGVQVDGGGRMLGALMVGNNAGGDCVDAGELALDSGCGNQGTSNATVQRSVNPTDSSFIGPIGVDDGANASDSNGTAGYSDIDAWTVFDNDYRMWMRQSRWGQGNGARCGTGSTCEIVDFSLHEDDTLLRNKVTLPTGDDALTHVWNADETGCDDVPGASWDGSACVVEFLPGAVETLDDAFGNDNGLCEDFDSCFFLRNIGAYQGHGRIRMAGAFSDGLIEGVTMRRFANNGRPTP